MVLKTGLLHKSSPDPDPIEETKNLLAIKNYTQFEELIRQHLGRLEEDGPEPRGLDQVGCRKAFPTENLLLDPFTRRHVLFQDHYARRGT